MLNLTSKQLLGLFICVCLALCTFVVHDTAQNRPDNFPSYPPDSHHCSDDVYLRAGGFGLKTNDNYHDDDSNNCMHCKYFNTFYISPL